MPVININNSAKDRENYLCAAMLRGSKTNRNFDNCLENNDADLVAANVWKRALRNPRLMAVLPKYLCMVAVPNSYRRIYGDPVPAAVIDGTQLCIDAEIAHMQIGVLDRMVETLSRFKEEARGVADALATAYPTVHPHVARGVVSALESKLAAASFERATELSKSDRLNLMADVHKRLLEAKRVAVKKGVVQVGDQFKVTTFLPAPFSANVVAPFDICHQDNVTRWDLDALKVLIDEDQSTIEFVNKS